MRRILRILPLLLALACTKSTVTPAVRLDFVGGSRFTSSTRTLNPTTPADTLASKIYVQSDTTLQRLQIRLTSSPTRTPVLYSLSGIAAVPLKPDTTLVYLDSLLPAHTKDLAFTNLLSARTSSGIDLWEYTATDSRGSTASRAYRLVLRRPDSTAVVQSYRLYVSPVPYRSPALTPAQDRAFAYVGLRQGLLLPHFAVATQSAAIQALIDVVCIASGADIRLASTASASLTVATKPTQRTELVSTGLKSTDFPGLTTNVLLRAAFTGGSAYPAAGSSFDALVTTPLVKGSVIAFRITDSKTPLQKYGALLVADLVRTPTAIVTCQVLVEK